MKTAEVEIEWNGKMEKVKLKRLSYGETNDVTEQAATIRYVGEQPHVSVSQKVLREVSLVKSVISAPFAINIESIRALDITDGNKLFEAYTELNNQSPKPDAPSTP